MLKEDKATQYVSSKLPDKNITRNCQPCSYRQPFQPAETTIIQNCCILLAPPGETASQCTAYQNKRGQSYTYCLMRRKGQFGHLRWIWGTIFLLLSQPNLLSLYPLGSHVSHSSRKSVPKTAKKTYEVVIRWKVTRRNYHILQSASHD